MHDRSPPETVGQNLRDSILVDCLKEFHNEPLVQRPDMRRSHCLTQLVVAVALVGAGCTSSEGARGAGGAAGGGGGGTTETGGAGPTAAGASGAPGASGMEAGGRGGSSGSGSGGTGVNQTAGANNAG